MTLCSFERTAFVRAIYLRHLVIMPEGFHPFPYRTRKLRPPGPRILGAQAPGKIGHRQVTNKKAISNEVAFSLVFRCWSVLGPTLQEYALRDAVWRKAPFARKCSFGVAGSAILSTGDYRAFRSRAKDTWGASPWENRSSPGKQERDYI